MNILKNLKRGFTLMEIVIVSAIVALLAVLSIQKAGADNQGYPSTQILCTNLPAVLQPAAGATTNTWFAIPIWNGVGLALEYRGYSATAETNTFDIYPSIDGTNALTTGWTWTFPVSVSLTTAGTNWNALQLAGYQYLLISNQVAIGSGNITNLFLQANRPND